DRPRRTPQGTQPRVLQQCGEDDFHLEDREHRTQAALRSSAKGYEFVFGKAPLEEPPRTELVRLRIEVLARVDHGNGGRDTDARWKLSTQERHRSNEAPRHHGQRWVAAQG